MTDTLRRLWHECPVFRRRLSYQEIKGYIAARQASSSLFVLLPAGKQVHLLACCYYHYHSTTTPYHPSDLLHCYHHAGPSCKEARAGIEVPWPFPSQFGMDGGCIQVSFITLWFPIPLCLGFKKINALPFPAVNEINAGCIFLHSVGGRETHTQVK